MNFDNKELKNTCTQLAKSANHSYKGQASAAFVSVLSNRFHIVACKKALSLHSKGKDAEVVNRAVWYISLVHSSSPYNDHVIWFRELLDSLIELAYPHTHFPLEDSQEFLQNFILCVAQKPVTSTHSQPK